jgi:hypothetical protein
VLRLQISCDLDEELLNCYECVSVPTRLKYNSCHCSLLLLVWIGIRSVNYGERGLPVVVETD